MWSPLMVLRFPASSEPLTAAAAFAPVCSLARLFLAFLFIHGSCAAFGLCVPVCGAAIAWSSCMGYCSSAEDYADVLRLVSACGAAWILCMDYGLY